MSAAAELSDVTAQMEDSQLHMLKYLASSAFHLGASDLFAAVASTTQQTSAQMKIEIEYIPYCCSSDFSAEMKLLFFSPRRGFSSLNSRAV